MQLEVCNLNTYYGESHVLQGVDLKIAEGELVGLLGRNGMGKSTTLKSIMGVVSPKSGTITFEGKNITGMLPHKVARTGIAYVPEERRIFAELSVKDNLLLGVKGGKIRHANDPNVWTLERIFEHFPKLKERVDSEGRHLSGGEQQMLAIGRALLTNPKLLIMDEPSEGLAPAIVDHLVDVFQNLAEGGLHVLLIEQKLGVATALAGRQLVMVGGEIVIETTAEQLSTDRELQQRYLGIETLAAHDAG
jgi:branched-chain amino acid transport system ATP-binding protein